MQRFTDQPVNKSVITLQLLSTLVMLCGFVRILVVADAAGITIGLAGTVIFQLATLLGERSFPVRLLGRTPVSALMLNNAVPVSSSWSVEKAKSLCFGQDNRVFFAIVQDGHLTGVALTADLYSLSDRAARHTPVGQVARPIEYVHAVLPDDSALDAFSMMRRCRRTYLLVTDNTDALIGLVTRDHIDRLLQAGSASDSTPLKAATLNEKSTRLSESSEPEYKVAA